MPKSQNNSSILSYIPEVTYGVTPSTPTMITLPFASHSLDLVYETLAGTDIESNEQESHMRLGNRRVSGDIVADLRKGDFDYFLESVMRGSWSTNTLKIGQTRKSFTLEETATDISRYLQFTGNVVNSMGVSIQAGATSPVQATFGIMGKDRTRSGTTIATALTATSTNSPFDHHSGDLAIGDVGSSSAMCVTSINFDVNRNYEGAYCVGDPTINEMLAGKAAITGSFTAYYMDDAILARFQDETLTEISVSVDDQTGANPYTFLFPSVKLTSAPVPVSGPTGPRLIEASFTALYDATEDSALVITRTA